MRPEGELDVVVGSLTGVPVRDRFYRATQLQHLSTLTSTVGAWRGENRFTRPQLSQALYVAEGPDLAMMEATRQFQATFERQPVPGYVIYPVRVRLDRVLDLTDEQVHDTLGTSHMELTGDWRAERECGRIPPTWRVGEAAFRAGFGGVLYASAYAGRRRNLVVFTEHCGDMRRALSFGLDPAVEEFVRWKEGQPG